MSSQNSSTLLFDVHTALRSLAKVDKATNRSDRLTACAFNAAQLGATGYAAATGRTLNPFLRHKELNKVGRTMVVIGFTLRAVTTVIAINETLTLDGAPELDKLKK